MNRIDEMTDAFMKFFDEYAQKQQVFPPQPTKAVNYADGMGVVANQKPSTTTTDEGAEQSSSAPSGIHLVPEPPAIPEEPEWSDSDTAREQYDNITGRS